MNQKCGYVKSFLVYKVFRVKGLKDIAMWTSKTQYLKLHKKMGF